MKQLKFLKRLTCMMFVMTLIISGLPNMGAPLAAFAAETAYEAPMIFYEKFEETSSGTSEVYYVDEDGNRVDWGNIVLSEEITERLVSDAMVYTEENGTSEEYFNTGAQTYSSTGGTTFGESYDPTQEGTTLEMPAVRNQGSYGVCWAFAASAAAEINIRKNRASFITAPEDVEIDISERHLAYFAHNTFTTDKTDPSYGDGVKKATVAKAYVGGNSHEVAYSAARGSAFALEELAPYAPYSLGVVPESMRYYQAVTLKNWYDYGNYYDMEDNLNTVKAAITNYGAVMASYYSDDASYHDPGLADGRLSHYCTYETTNHAIAIVGWDDTYSASNFGTAPEGDGAWLVRNSWGGNWSTDGYFWLSYYDKSIRGIFAFEVDDTANYSKTYNYTGGSSSVSVGWGKTEAQEANIFKATEDETLVSVGVFTRNSNLSVSAYIYVNDEVMEHPTDGTLKSTVENVDGTVAGFHRIDLTDAVSLKEGQYFSVIIKMTSNTGEGVWLYGENKTGAKVGVGKTFYHNGSNWVDATKAGTSVGNARVYAYTSCESKDAEFDAMVSAYKTDITSEVITNFGGDVAVYNKLMAFAEDEDARQAGTVAWIKMGLTSAVAGMASNNMYADAKFTTEAGNADGKIRLYVNGSSALLYGLTTKFNAKTVYLDIDRVQSLNSKGKLAYAGKYVVAYTTEFELPTLNTDGTLSSVDTAAQGIVKASVSGSKLTISPLAKGDVYVWVLYFPTSSSNQEAYLTRQQSLGTSGYAVAKVSVDVAPKAVRLYADAAVDLTDVAEAKNVYTSSLVPVGGSATVYAKGVVGSVSSKASTLEEIEGTGFNIAIAKSSKKYEDYITVTEVVAENGTVGYKFEVAEDFPLVAGKTKTVNVSYTISSEMNAGKKATFKLLVGNPVKTMTLAANDDTTQVEIDGYGVAVVTLESAATAAQTASLKESTVLYNTSLGGTDVTKVVKLPWGDAYYFNSTGLITADGKTSAEQNKVAMKAVKAKDGTYTYTITAKKGTMPGTEAYFAVYHNSYEKTSGRGYQIVKVVVGEANHATALTLAKTSGTGINTNVILAREGGTSNYTAMLPSAKSAAEYAYLTETLTFANDGDGTDGSAIYKLPCAGTEAFTIAKNGMVTVNGPLSAAQKKVSMAAVKGAPGEFKITVAKGTPDGTKAYFLLYHNTELYTIITVTVGTANKVTQSDIAIADGTAEIDKATGKTTVITVPYSTVKQTVVLKETVTLESEGTTTDVTQVLRMASEDGYEVALHGASVTAKGTLTAAQKKINMALKKGTTDTFNLTVAAKTPVGTETYFIVYHNNAGTSSGTGYHIVKVVVTE